MIISKRESIYNARRWKNCTLTLLCAGCAVIIDCNYSRIHWKICILNAVQYFGHQTYLLMRKEFLSVLRALVNERYILFCQQYLHKISPVYKKVQLGNILHYNDFNQGLNRLINQSHHKLEIRESRWPIKVKLNNIMNQWEHEVNMLAVPSAGTRTWPNRDWLWFTYDWLSSWNDFPATKITWKDNIQPSDKLLGMPKELTFWNQ